jgi:protein required for attachment to host cells
MADPVVWDTRSKGKLVMVKKVKTWIVVADGSHARVFERVGKAGELTSVFERDDPEARKRTSDLVSDTRGRSAGGAGGARHAMELKVTPHQHLENVFIRNLAHEIDQAATGSKFERLILALPPRALGEMRAALSQAARDRVVAEFDRELISLSEKALVAYVDQHAP